jgi:Cys-tRNA synthase (O-phospho-L-seryl-tRNA:Cys-tRNA synthase)
MRPGYQSLIWVLLITVGVLASGCRELVDTTAEGRPDTAYVQAAQGSDEKLAIDQLRNIHRAQQLYHGEKGRYATMAELIDQGTIISRDPSHHYRFTITANENSYECVTVPQAYGTDGRYSYFIDDSGVVRGADHKGGPATATDPNVQ